MKSAFVSFLKGPLEPKSDAPEIPAASQWDDPSVDVLRQKIIAHCNDKVKVFQRIATMNAFEKGKHYTLHSVVLGEARACVPGGPCGGWDVVNYRLNLENHALSVRCLSDPALYGSPPEWTFSITPEDFCKVVVSHSFPNELRNFRTASDWDRLFNDDVNAAVNRMCAEAEKSEQLAKEAECRERAIRIPDELFSQAPKLHIIKAVFTVNSDYGSSQVSLTREADKYVLSVTFISQKQFLSDRNLKRELTPAEAVWAERIIAEGKRNPNQKTMFSSAAMDVQITESHSADFSYNGVQLKKYRDVMDQLDNLAQYGSAAAENR